MNYLTRDYSEIDTKATYKRGREICESYRPIMMGRMKQTFYKCPGAVIQVSTDKRYKRGDEAALAKLSCEGDQTDLFMKFLESLKESDMYQKNGDALWSIYVEGYSIDDYSAKVERSRSTVLQWIRDGWILAADYCHAVVYKEKRIYNFCLEISDL